ncbi:MAG: MutS-related protein, partial [Candidatus Methylomirabilales bacterium]
RGTSTYDGMSIAWAVAEFIHDVLASRTLFATHYHELTRLAGQLEGVRNLSMAVAERGHELIFLRQVIPGGADKSYGIHVAKLAGLPDPVIRRAQALLQEHEGRNAPPTHTLPYEGGGKKKGCTGPSLIAERLLQIDPLRTTPFEALLLLAELKELAIKHPTPDTPK